MIFLLFIMSSAQEIKYPLSYLRFIGETAGIEEASLSSLDSLANFLKLTNVKIEIGGHTDNVGAPTEKIRLSELRAKAVYDYLKSKHKIPEQNLIYKGYGPSMPIATNRTPEGRARNNRIEIKVLSPIPSGRLEYIKSKVTFHKEGISEPQEIIQSLDLTLYDRILTDTLGRANLQFNGSVIKILPSSDVTIKNLNPSQKTFEIYLNTGRIIASIINDNLLIITPTCSLKTNQAEFILKSEMYNQDLVSVWSGSLEISAGGVSETINENYGTVCYYGKKPMSTKLLPLPPAIDTAKQRDYLSYDGQSPFRFFFTNPADAKVHFLLSKDPELGDVIYEAIIESDSCVIKPIDLPRVYLWLGSVDESGLESKSLKTYSFEILNPKRRYTGPLLQITRQVMENTEKGRVILLEGKTEPECELLINDVKVKVQKNGTFSFRAKVSPNTQFVNLSSIDKRGKKTVLQIPVGRKVSMGIEIFSGLSVLAGGGLDASKIGLIFGGDVGYNLKDRIVIGLFANTGTISCKTTDWEPQGAHFKTRIYIGGLRLKYILNPFGDLSLHTGLEIGGGYWKSLYDGEVYEWAINPYAGCILGIKKDFFKKFSIFFECGVGYLRNKTKPNMGTQDINYIVPKGYLGLFYNP